MRSWGEGRRGAGEAGARASGRAPVRAGSSAVAGPCFFPHCPGPFLAFLGFPGPRPEPEFQRGPRTSSGASPHGTPPPPRLALRLPARPGAFPPGALCTGCRSRSPPSERALLLGLTPLLLGVGGSAPRVTPPAEPPLPPSIPDPPAGGSQRSVCWPARHVGSSLGAVRGGPRPWALCGRGRAAPGCLPPSTASAQHMLALPRGCSLNE